jgi:hypothetical protein
MEFNPDNLPTFSLPPKLINQLYEFSGNTEGTRGFLLLHINQEGRPVIYFKTDNQIIELGLRKALEQFIIDFEESDRPIDLEGEGPENEE